LTTFFRWFLFTENCLIFLSGQKEGKFAESFAAVYKGEVIEEFSKAEMSKFYKKWNKLKGEELLEALENVYKKATFEFEEFSKSVPEFATDSALAKESYNLFNQKKWKELEELFKARNIKWPPNRGGFDIEEITLEAGTLVDRYGGQYDDFGNFSDTGNFVSPKGTNFEKRALPNEHQKKPLKVYEILKPIKATKKAKIIPWFNKRGLGIQYELPENIDELIQEGFLKLKN